MADSYRGGGHTLGTEESISLREAAEQLGVHYMTAYRYVRTGTLTAHQHNGQWYVDAAVLAEFAKRRAESPPRPGRPRADAPVHTSKSLAPRRAIALADRFIHGDQTGAWNLVDEALTAGAGLRQINNRLITPALCRIGELWESGDTSVGDEHRATVVAYRLIDRVGQRFTRPGRKSGTVVISAAPGDRHGLPSAILSDLLRAEGLDVVDLGADTPGKNIVQIATRQDRLIAVGISATTPLKRAAASELGETVRAVREATGRPVLVGGRAITDAIAARVAPDHRSLDADDAVTWFVDLAHRPQTRRGERSAN